MKKLAAALVALAILALPLAAGAQDNDRPAPASTGTATVTRYTFDDHPVPGRDFSTDTELLRVRARQGHGSLIRVREHFVSEMLKSAEHF